MKEYDRRHWQLEVEDIRRRALELLRRTGDARYRKIADSAANSLAKLRRIGGRDA